MMRHAMIAALTASSLLLAACPSDDPQPDGTSRGRPVPRGRPCGPDRPRRTARRVRPGGTGRPRRRLDHPIDATGRGQL
jgi:hypothetical protein